jgi:hypothetical protein
MKMEMQSKQMESSNAMPKGSEHVKGNIAKTDYQKNQTVAPFQGYNFFGTKSKWD